MTDREAARALVDQILAFVDKAGTFHGRGGDRALELQALYSRSKAAVVEPLDYLTDLVVAELRRVRGEANNPPDAGW